MDYLGALRMFVRAVEVGSFSKAAIATNTKTSTVSRAIASANATQLPQPRASNCLCKRASSICCPSRIRRLRWINLISWAGYSLRAASLRIMRFVRRGADSSPLHCSPRCRSLCRTRRRVPAQSTRRRRRLRFPVVRLFPAGMVLNGGAGMAINRLLSQSKLKPEEIERLNKAYSYALRSLSLVDVTIPSPK